MPQGLVSHWAMMCKLSGTAGTPMSCRAAHCRVPRKAADVPHLRHAQRALALQQLQPAGKRLVEGHGGGATRHKRMRGRLLHLQAPQVVWLAASPVLDLWWAGAGQRGRRGSGQGRQAWMPHASAPSGVPRTRNSTWTSSTRTEREK